jgi:hypothetical protein
MAVTPIRKYAARVLPVVESTFGTAPDPAAAQYHEVRSINMGPVSTGVIRPKMDRAIGRGMQNDFVEGRKQLVPWSLEAAVMGRAAVDTVPLEDPYYRAGGLLRTINAATNVIYATQGNPTLTGLTLDCVSDTALNAQLGERGYGGAVETLEWTGGDAELELKVGGKFIDKELRGKLDSITLASGVVTTLTITAEESYRLGLGYYWCEAEAIRVTACTPGGTSATITRAQLGTTGVAHTAQPLVPYTPALTNPAGRPLPESTSTFTCDGVALRLQSWGIKMATGIAHLPGETGSQRVQGLKAVRYNFDVTAKGVLHEDYVSLLGKATARRTCPLVIVQGTGTGRVATFSLPTTELVAVPVADSKDDVAMVDLSWRVRDNAASDAFSLTLT